MIAPSCRRTAAVLALLTLLAPAAESGTGFRVRYSPDLTPGPITARVYVMLGATPSLSPPRMGPDWFQPKPFFAVEARDWKADEPLLIGDDAAGFPGPLSSLPPGTYAAQAVVRLNPDTHRLGNGEGNAFGPVAKFTIAEGDPAAEPIDLTVDQRVPPREFRETDRIKLVEIDSPLLSAFHGRRIRHRAAVILPQRAEGDERKLPTLYIIPGFGGDHHMAHALARGAFGGGFGRDFIRVLLDPDCGTGHHVFADSATNGPRGRALVEELIPHIEASYPALADPKARLLTGHSSGGWSSLWLAIRYPESFGGSWSTSPDPVDFRDFQQINLYAERENMFRDRRGNRRPIARRGTQPVLWYDDFSRMEDVIGDGGQLHSFEAVFSPLDEHGRPRPLWDRATGTIDPETARAWEAYDIRLILERRWAELGPRLGGKLHVYMGDVDTFYLEGATRLLKESLANLGSDAVVELFPGKDHSNLIDAGLAARSDREMRAAVAGLRPDLAPTQPVAR